MSTVDELTREVPMIPSVTVNGRPLVDDAPAPPARRKRVKGLRLKAVPSAALTAQVVGALLMLVGLFALCAILWGPGIAISVTMLVVGVASVALGTLREANII